MLRCAPLLLVLASAAKAAVTDSQVLAHELLIADTHIDMPWRQYDEGWLDLRDTTERDFDLPKARAGGLDLAFMSIYTPSSLAASGDNRKVADRLIDAVEAMVQRAPDDFVLVRDPEQARAAKASGRMGVVLGMENGSAIGGSIEGLRHFAARGVRYITLAHALQNELADSSYDREHRRAGGLSAFGLEVIAEMNRLGVMVDVSHLSDDAVRTAVAASQVPVIASHSSARHFTPGWERNLSDELIDAIAAKGGVIQVTFGSGFVSAEANQWSEALKAARAAAGVADEGAAADAFDDEYRRAHPYPFATVAAVADHIDYIAKRVGVEHVGLGSDFDGVGDTLPIGLKSSADYPALLAELQKRGYDKAALAQIAGGNLLRVWARVAAYGKAHRGA